MALEADLAASEAEKKRLAREVEELKKRAPAAQPQAPTVAPGSDLFEALRKENAQLKEKAAALDTDKENSARSQSELAAALEKAQSELAALKSADEKQKQSLGTLVERLPAMEQEMNELRASSKEKDARLREQEKALQAMSVEIRQREHRLVKAERMTEVMEKTRADLKQVSDQEKRDMHFNMAAVYTREGKLQDAESEYLRALRLDPCDADVHFNLGILYDDHMDQKRKAAMHYRRYLKLMPDANDAETVRAWLLAIETEARE
jgi:tetratricopeptide (TPR) repeat protein